MINSTYENHIHLDPHFHVIFNYQELNKHSYSDMMHWHESIELLYILKGDCTATCNLVPIHAAPGDIIIVNSNELHSFKPSTDSTEYYYLIIDKSIYESFGLDIEGIIFNSKITDPIIHTFYSQIIEEMANRALNYKLAVKANIINLLIGLLRTHVAEDKSLHLPTTQNQKIELTKSAIRYIRKNLDNTPSLDDICLHVGFSKYYLCRTFKEVTHKTIIEYINSLRCQKAQKLLLSGNYNVTEVAQLCHFNSLPYFCRMYKKHLGISPSTSLPSSQDL